jgi:hypothetical protein
MFPLLLMLAEPENRLRLQSSVIVFAYIALLNFAVHMIAVRTVTALEVLTHGDQDSAGHCATPP